MPPAAIIERPRSNVDTRQEPPPGAPTVRPWPSTGQTTSAGTHDPGNRPYGLSPGARQRGGQPAMVLSCRSHAGLDTPGSPGRVSRSTVLHSMWTTVWTDGDGRGGDCSGAEVGGVTTPDEDFPRIWDRALEALESAGVTPQQRAFVRLTRPVGLLDGTALLAAPNDLTKEVLEQRMRETITSLLSAQIGQQVRLAVMVDTSLPSDAVIDVRDARDQAARVGGGGRADGARSEPTRLRFRQRHRPGPPDRRGAAEPEVHLRDLRDRRQQPVRARRGGRRRRGAGEGVQPAVRLRRVRPRQDPPAARDRALRAEPLPRRPGPLRELRGVHQRLHQLDPGRQGQRVPAPLPRRRRAADRRHPVPAGQGADAGGVLPHLQHPAQREQAGRDHLRPAAEAAGRLRGADALTVRVGPDHRRAAARPRDPDRDPAQEGDRRAAAGAATTCWSTSPARSPRTSASSRVR